MATKQFRFGILHLNLISYMPSYAKNKILSLAKS